ncbi:MAG: hypothetical protein AAGA31_15420, partial [Bacteroidota bacterium]
NEYRTFKQWAASWSQQRGITIPLPDQLKASKEKSTRYRLVNKWIVDDGFAQTVYLEIVSRQQKQILSGDLLAIRPKPTAEPRYYSVGKLANGNLFLAVKKHPYGQVSTQLYQLSAGSYFKGVHRISKHFHFPHEAPKVIMIANGTGIGPFIGMLHDDTSSTPRRLLWGVRNQASLDPVADIFDTAQNSGSLSQLSLAFSREESKYRYVQDIITAQAIEFARELAAGAVVMICGSLAMQKGVFAALEEALKQLDNGTLAYYQDTGQVLTDCY